MEVAFWWIGLSVLAGVIAANKGRSGFGFFIISLVLSPLLGVLFALAAQRGEAIDREDAIERGELRKCPHCAEYVKAEATRCRYCQADIPKVFVKPTPLQEMGAWLGRTLSGK